MSKKKPIDGISQAIALLKGLEPRFRHKFLTKLDKEAVSLSKLYLKCEFLYSDIQRLDPKSTEKLLQEIPEEKWLLAWKLSNKETRAHLLHHMSKARSERFLEATRSQQRVRKSQVIMTQISIANKAKEGLLNGSLSFAHCPTSPQSS